ncbi:MAG: type II toxin-antitoxin system VapC family toxin, partial [Synergistaceae bacterium]|nr:type II toxin-antitoxin system VapC family toxin [Synergistaceae bacterium]
DWPIFQKLKAHVGKDICISVITLGELEYGIRKSSRPDMTRFGVYTFLAGIPVIDFDADAAKHFGDILGDLELKRMRIRS